MAEKGINGKPYFWGSGTGARDQGNVCKNDKEEHLIKYNGFNIIKRNYGKQRN